VNTVAEALADEHTFSRRMIVTTEHPRFGEVRQVASPVRVGDAEPSYRRAPSRGEDTDDVLGELLGYDAARITELRSRSAFGEEPEPE
jgi:crotonobetainyl-CoA:carnitine CoA-transferase CaiB-like acyl-CoA transferase